MDWAIIALALILWCCIFPSVHSAWLTVMCKFDITSWVDPNLPQKEKVSRFTKMMECYQSWQVTIPALLSCLVAAGVFVWGFVKAPRR